MQTSHHIEAVRATSRTYKSNNHISIHNQQQHFIHS